MYNAFFMDLPVSSFCVPFILLTAECVDLVVACDGFVLQWKLSFFIVVTLITKKLFERLFILL